MPHTVINESLEQLFPDKFIKGKNQFFKEDENFNFVSSEVDLLLNDPIIFDIFHKAHLGNGFNKKDYIALNGTRILNGLQKLIIKEVVIEKAGNIVGCYKNFQTSMDTALNSIKTSVHYFDKEKMGTNSNHAYFSTGVVDVKGREFLYHWQRLSRDIERAKFDNKLISNETKKEIINLLNKDVIYEKKNKQVFKMFKSSIYDDFTKPSSKEKRLQ